MNSQGHSVQFSIVLYLKILVVELQRVPDLVDGHQQVLAHVALVVVVPDGLPLSELEEGDLGRHHPAHEETEPELVAEGQDQLALPVEGPRVPVVVLHKATTGKEEEQREHVSPVQYSPVQYSTVQFRMASP